MMGDIDSGLQHARATSFADDTRVKKSIETEEDVKLLQEDLNRLLHWADRNNMELSGEKFEVVRYGQNQELKETTHYQAQQLILTPKEHVRDLGVYMSADASFTKNIDSIIDTARKLSGWILRTFQTRNRSCMLTLESSGSAQDRILLPAVVSS